MRNWPFIVLMLSVPAFVSAEPLPRFKWGSVFQQDISNAALHPQSQNMINTVMGICSGDATGCGFGFGRMQIDWSIHVVHAAPGAPMLPVAAHADYGYYTESCDAVGSMVPVPLDGAIEGETGYTCDNTAADCHLLVVQGDRLFELYSTTQAPNPGPSTRLEALCLATWQLDAVYPPDLRGDHCTSADAAGFPIAPLLFNADEIAAAPPSGDLGHAIRFILPNDRMASWPDGADDDTDRDPVYVRPATHAGGPDGPLGAIPYGSRLRLKSNFNMAGYSPAAQVILRTMQRYGIVLSDGGRIALTSESDLYTNTKWADLGIETNEFFATAGATPVNLVHFDIIDTGPQIHETYECVRTVVASTLFLNGFE